MASAGGHRLLCAGGPGRRAGRLHRPPLPPAKRTGRHSRSAGGQVAAGFGPGDPELGHRREAGADTLVVNCNRGHSGVGPACRRGGHPLRPGQIHGPAAPSRQSGHGAANDAAVLWTLLRCPAAALPYLTAGAGLFTFVSGLFYLQDFARQWRGGDAGMKMERGAEVEIRRG